MKCSRVPCILKKCFNQQFLTSDFCTGSHPMRKGRLCFPTPLPITVSGCQVCDRKETSPSRQEAQSAFALAYKEPTHERTYRIFVVQLWENSCKHGVQFTGRPLKRRKYLEFLLESHKLTVCSEIICMFKSWSRNCPRCHITLTNDQK